MGDSPQRAGWRRRGVLRALALAPLAGCAGARGERAVTGANAVGGGPAPAQAAHAASGPSADAVAAVRAFPLAADAEPAFVFRAAVARPPEPR